MILTFIECNVGSYKVSEAKMNVKLIFLVLSIRYATNYFFKASNGIWWPVFVTVLHLTLKDCRKLSFSRVTCCFDWSSSHFDSWQCFQNFVLLPRKKSQIFPAPVPVDWFLEQKLLSMWQALYLWYQNVILTIKNAWLILFVFCHIV